MLEGNRLNRDLMKKGLRRIESGRLRLGRKDLNRDLMKKGLRRQDVAPFPGSNQFESRPYEEGIKTIRADKTGNAIEV